MSELSDQSEATGLDKRVRKQWMARLLHSNPQVRQNAQIALRDLPIEAQVELTRRCVQRVTGKRAEASAWILLGFVAVAFLALPWFHLGFFPATAWLAAILLLRPFYENNIENEVANNLVDRIQDAGFLPFAMVRLEREYSRNTPLRNIICGRVLRNAILRLLRFVQEEDAALWNETEQEAFLAPLAVPLSDVERTIATLRALERVGSEAALPLVQKLAGADRKPAVQQVLDSMKENDRKENERLIEEAAQHCLPILEARVAAQQQAQTLLRAAGEPDTSGILLRPSSETAEQKDAAEQLLRPQQ